ncbi:hypothetical protein DACRYDRAFT_23777 [Dacryopinax primogenitus]|uniref:Macrofage activating glyco protein n=1 Tax=Dacryopinax primogenitus (strain DJM 731) TaxID=1858805 RepID=M5G7L9_DACPD|nr:uncharacterized protein DACRYDRAFT_23777 [Dacryopinax primogenitus]EJT99772.1 hypothetical protein DACRYDRAFT_23777 [Dacryopinax primogenitus]
MAATRSLLPLLLLGQSLAHSDLLPRAHHARAPLDGTGTTITAAPAASEIALAKRQDATSTCNFDLVSAQVAFDQIPYQVDPCTDGRGPQYGYNMCNSTTQNQDSLCQTIYLNNLADFCVWAPPTPNTNISDSEGYEVAWCTKNGHGTRLIPDGALKGAQLLRTPNYIQIVGFIDQTMINMPADDEGGELDGRGQDNRGNPMGGLTYSNAYNGSNTTYYQMLNWQWFMGSDIFCAKICPGAAYDPDAYAYCFNQDDEVGCNYNMPNAAQNGTFEVCDADNAPPVGQYVGADGKTSTWTQGWTGFSTIPYTPIPPSSSNCVTYQSAELFTDLAGVLPSSAPASLTASSAGATNTVAAGNGAGTSRNAAGSAPTSGASTGTGTSSAPAAMAGLPIVGMGLLALVGGLFVLV